MKILEKQVPGLVGSIPTQSRQLNTVKGSSEFLSYIDQRELGLFSIEWCPNGAIHILVPFIYSSNPFK